MNTRLKLRSGYVLCMQEVQYRVHRLPKRIHCTLSYEGGEEVRAVISEIISREDRKEKQERVLEAIRVHIPANEQYHITREFCDNLNRFFGGE